MSLQCANISPVKHWAPCPETWVNPIKFLKIPFSIFKSKLFIDQRLDVELLTHIKPLKCPKPNE